jgi:hypothetical protein
MSLKSRILTILAAVAMLPGVLHAQFSFEVDKREVQVHSFFSQGFAYSDDNNYMTMKTSAGSFAFTDFGANISTQVTDKFRVGAQIYDREIGHLGEFHPQLDWAYGDYKFASWFGVRAGKVKTVEGLYNDVQDMSFLHTWAILPQSIYPLDLRASTIAHVGGDIYGSIGVSKHGEVSYTGYAGIRPQDAYGGYQYGLTAKGAFLTSTPGWQTGGDLRWSNLVKGLVVGASYMYSPLNAFGTLVKGTASLPLSLYSESNAPTVYAEYKHGNLTVASEYRREVLKSPEVVRSVMVARINNDMRGGYMSVAYRFSKRLELGTYRSLFYPQFSEIHSLPADHLFDQAVTAKVNLKDYWDIKVEGHFMDGVATTNAMLRGFYPQNNPQGFAPTTNMLVIRTSWNF